MRFDSVIRRGLGAVFVALPILALVAGPAHAASDWPRHFGAPDGEFVVYQPQPEHLEGDVLTGRMAFSLQKTGATYPTYGVLWFQSRVVVDRDSSTVDQRELDVTLVRLPGIGADEARQYETLVESEARHWDLEQPLDELKSGLAASAQERASVEGLDHRAPQIRFAYQRSLLVIYDGAPVLETLEDSRLQRVANTPYAVIYDPRGKTYYLRGAGLWYTARDPLGPWKLVGGAPDEVAAAVPADTAAADVVKGEPPAIETATEPTELISFDGEPLLEPLVGDRLLYATNTESDVLRDVDTQSLYVLLAGRWYRAQTEAGPWSYVSPDQLPEIFSRIPPDSPKGNLLASVAGTAQADDAVADDEIPQTSAIHRDNADAQVEWDGNPQFDSIAGTDLQYGVNTDAQILYDRHRYYLCDHGVWYYADRPQGPWRVAIELPAGLDELPPSCPVYNLRWTAIYEVTPDIVYVGYLPGYLGYYPCRGVVVYGTGYRYKPWRGHRRYYPRPITWGCGARYNPWLSRWSFGLSYEAGFLRIATRWHRGPHRRWDEPWFGPGGYHRPWLANDRTLSRTPPPRRVRTQDATPMSLYNRSDNAARVVKFKDLPAGRIINVRPRVAPLPNDVFAGRDGRVYRRTPSGQWNVNDGGQWKPTELPKRPTRPPASPPVFNGGAGRVRQPQPTPVRRPATPPAPIGQPPPVRREPVEPRPVRPTPAPSPGSLEPDFEARQRSVQPPPAPAPPKPEAKPIEKSREEPKGRVVR